MVVAEAEAEAVTEAEVGEVLLPSDPEKPSAQPHAQAEAGAGAEAGAPAPADAEGDADAEACTIVDIGIVATSNSHGGAPEYTVAP